MSDIPTFADLVSLCEAHDLQPPSISASDGQVTVTVRVGQVPTQ